VIQHLDTVLRRLLMTEVGQLQSDTQIRFQPPDDQWRQVVSNLTVNGQPANAVNVYLVDLRENRKLRTNERVRVVDDFGFATETPAPRRVDCHYLLSAWSPATATPAVEPSIDEHELIFEVAAALVKRQPIVPREVFDPAPVPPAIPAILADAELPSHVMPVEGFPKLAEFWGTMGQTHPWRPSVYLQVTLPVAAEAIDIGPIVTTRGAGFGQGLRPSTFEVRVQIGGRVLDATQVPIRPLEGAWIRLEAPDGRPIGTTLSDRVGRFSFSDVNPGPYRLRWLVGGQAPPPARDIDVPSPSGEYELRLE
jgi:hypothetical protein